MSRREIRLTRSELYEKVWSIPIHRLAESYGLSDVGLAKICKKHKIPRPPRGYWARLAAGQKLSKTSLPTGKKDQVIVISSNQNSKSREKAAIESLEINPVKTPIIIPETLRNAHFLVKQSAEILKTGNPDNLGLLSSESEDCLDIKVSKKNMRRALLIMDGLIKALEEHGNDVILSDNSTKVRIHDLTIKISISEELMTVHKEPEKHDLDGYYQFGHSTFNTMRVASGNLCLTIDESFWRWNQHYRKNWRDTVNKRLEDQLDGFLRGIFKAFAQKKAYLQEEDAPRQHLYNWD